MVNPLTYRHAHAQCNHDPLNTQHCPFFLFRHNLDPVHNDCAFPEPDEDLEVDANTPSLMQPRPFIAVLIQLVYHAHMPGLTRNQALHQRKPALLLHNYTCGCGLGLTLTPSFLPI